MQDEISLSVKLCSFGAPNLELDHIRVRASRHDEIVFQLVLVAVINEIDPGLDVFVFHLGVVRDIRAPLLGIIADEMVAFALQFIRADDFGTPVGFDKFHAENRRGWGLGAESWGIKR